MWVCFLGGPLAKMVWFLFPFLKREKHAPTQKETQPCPFGLAPIFVSVWNFTKLRSLLFPNRTLWKPKLSVSGFAHARTSQVNASSALASGPQVTRRPLKVLGTRMLFAEEKRRVRRFIAGGSFPHKNKRERELDCVCWGWFLLKDR